MENKNLMQTITVALVVITIIVSGLSYMDNKKISSNVESLTSTTAELGSKITDSAEVIGELAEVVGGLGESMGEYGEEIAAILQKIETLEEAEVTKTAHRLKWEDWSRILYVGTTQEFEHLDIDVGRSRIDRFDAMSRSMKLLWPDPDVPGEYHPYLAKSWELKQNEVDEYYIEFKLKQGLKFQDGTDIDAEAVKYCWEREKIELYNREKNRETKHKHWCETSFKRLETPDKYTLWQFLPDDMGTFLPHPLAGMNLLFHGHIYSPTSTELWAKENDPIEGMINQVGYGPFILTDYVPGERVVYEAWEDMPENPAPLPTKGGVDKIIITTYADSATLRMALESGEIDMTLYTGISKADLEDLDENPDIEVQTVSAMGRGSWLWMNYRPEFAPLDDVRIRRAIAYAVFPEEIIEKTMFGLGIVGNSLVHPWMPYYIPAFEEIYRTMPAEERIAKAKELLIEAGYPDGFKTDFWISSGAGADQERSQATIIQAQLQRIGIKLVLKSIESGVYKEMRSEGRIGMSFGGWKPDYADPDSDLYSNMDNTGARYATYVDYDDQYVRDLLKLGKALYDPTGDPPERREIYEELQRIWAEDAVGISLFFEANYGIIRTWVKGYHINWHNYFAPLWNAYKEIPTDWETREPPH